MYPSGMDVKVSLFPLQLQARERKDENKPNNRVVYHTRTK